LEIDDFEIEIGEIFTGLCRIVRHQHVAVRTEPLATLRC
jgi:hypothetical protein